MTLIRSLAVALPLLSTIGGLGCNAQAVLTRQGRGPAEELEFLDGFDSRFAQYRKLDAEINREIVMLSRRDSSVRSFALMLGRKRVVTAQCEDQIRGLRETLAKHEMNATR